VVFAKRVAPGRVARGKRMGRVLFLLRQSAARFLLAVLLLSVIACLAFAKTENASTTPGASLELSRPARPWEFLCAVGTRAGLFGNESGRIEAWVYPLKLLRDFHLNFHVGGRVVRAQSLARTVVVRPESTVIVYSGDTFTVRETLFVPVNEPGAIILMDVETETPLDIEAGFQRDFQLEWPAALGGTYISWDSELRAFALGEEQKKFVAMVGSPTAVDARQEYQTNYSSSEANSFRLGVTQKGKERKMIALAASMEGRAAAEATYRRLSATYDDLLRQSSEYYRRYLSETVSLDLPDTQLQQAYDWSRVSMLQGMVSNPFLGTGLVAGYRTSGASQRPGFAWFFGRDSFWTSLALNSAGDFANTRTALEFVSKYQREDGKIPHEIAQGASFVAWFKDYPYGYASADATPLYIIAANDYVVQSGDAAFAAEKWDSLWKAYQFLRSTYDTIQGFPQNFGIGHGWVEGGPLLPVKTELYQTALGAEALRALSNLVRLAGKADASKELAQEFDRQRPLMERSFWLAEKNRYAFALDTDGKPIDEASVLATVPMWFGLLDEKNASAMITQLADCDHQTDWGMRIISDRSPKFSGGGYHYGSVWPLFTGWAAVGEYRYHRGLPAYANLRANALLALDGSPGHVTEVLSGDYYQPLSTSSPHQIWSAAMVVSPILRGMLGMFSDAKSGTLTFSPHVPPDWGSFTIRNARAGAARMDLTYSKTADEITLQINCTGGGVCPVEFEPALSPRADVIGAEMKGKPVPFRMATNEQDQHVVMRVSAASGQSSTLRIRVRNDFGISYQSSLPSLGARSQGLRMLAETWSAGRDTFSLEMAGAQGAQYDLVVWNADQVVSVDGAEFSKSKDGQARVRVQFPTGDSGNYSRTKIVFHFSGQQRRKNKNEKPAHN
jgi:glycogen debranching enzyme